jgi:hypothetical protein
MGACPSADATVKPLAARPVLMSYTNAAPTVINVPESFPIKSAWSASPYIQPAKLAHPVMVPSNPIGTGEHSAQLALPVLSVPLAEALSSTAIGALS